MKIVVAGALGHIGSAIIRQIPSKLDVTEIVMIDNMMTQRYCSLFNLPTGINYKFIEADLLNIDLEPVFNGADVVIQLAAITDAAGSFANRERVEHNNYNTTVKVAEACSKVGCRMVHLSSTSVYGTQKEVVDEECSPEELCPQSPYAETKLKEEQFLQQLGLTNNLRFVTFRFGTICGVSAGMRFHTAVNKFCWQAVMAQPITVWRTALNQKRPYLDLNDAVDAIAFVVKRDLYDKRIYNVLTDNLTVQSIVEAIQRYIPKIDIKYVDSEIMNQLSYNVSDRRFRSMGFTPQGSISEQIRETINLLKGCAGSRCKI